MRGMDIRLENDAGQIVGPGEIGEIVVESAFLALGYWKEPELTPRIIPTDAAEASASSVQVIWAVGGVTAPSNIAAARTQDQGPRVQCRAFSSGMRTHAPARRKQRGRGLSASQGCNQRSSIHRICGRIIEYFCVNTSEQLATRLPTHMVPSNIVVMDSFPMTAGGKMLRRALPLPKCNKFTFTRLPGGDQPDGKSVRWFLISGRKFFNSRRSGSIDELFLNSAERRCRR